jgi:hypothetical protein
MGVFIMKNVRNWKDIEWGQGTTRDGIKKAAPGYYGEPAANKGNSRDYQMLSNKEMNQLVLKLKERFENAETEEQKDEIRNSYEYFQVMRPYFGHLGWDANGKPRRNLVQSITEVVWHKLPDETVFSYQLWKNLEYAIVRYTGHDSDGQIIDFSSFAQITAKRLKAKQENDAKTKAEKEDKQGDGTKTRKRDKVYLEDLNVTDDEGNKEEFDMVDDRVDFLNEFAEEQHFGGLVNKLVSTSRQKDKAKFVLHHMAASFSRAEIARMMVDEFGGSEKTNEVFADRLHKSVRSKVEEMGLKFNTTWNLNNAKTYKGMLQSYKDKFYDKKAHDRNIYRHATYARNTSASSLHVENWGIDGAFEHAELNLKLNEAQKCQCRTCQGRVEAVKEQLEQIRRDGA